MAFAKTHKLHATTARPARRARLEEWRPTTHDQAAVRQSDELVATGPMPGHHPAAAATRGAGPSRGVLYGKVFKRWSLTEKKRSAAGLRITGTSATSSAMDQAEGRKRGGCSDTVRTTCTATPVRRS